MKSPDFSDSEYERRVEDLQRGLSAAGIDALLIADEKNYRYLTGHRTAAEVIPYVRRACWIFTDRPPVLIVYPSEVDEARELSPWNDIREQRGLGWGPMEVCAEPVVDAASNFADAIAEAGREFGVHEADAVGLCLGGWGRADLAIGTVNDVAQRLDVTWTDAAPTLFEARMVKSAAEIEYLRASVRAVDDAFAKTLAEVEEGMTERELAALMKANILLAGAEDALFAFVYSDLGRALAIGSAPGGDRLGAGRPIYLDAGALERGYWSDLNRLAVIGDPPDKAELAYSKMYQAQQAGIRAVRPGATAGEVATAIESELESAGFAIDRASRTPVEQGHGLGLEIPEVPFIVAGSDFELREGMALTIEPNAIYPGVGRLILEDDIVVTSEGAEHLSSAPTPERLIRI